jgi:hypothetical protein
MSLPSKVAHGWISPSGSGLLQRVVGVHADGPCVKAHLCAFGAKLAMALFREHVGIALPLSGAVWCQFALNAGMTQEQLNARIQILPIRETLRQGQKNVGDQLYTGITAMNARCSPRLLNFTVAFGSRFLHHLTNGSSHCSPSRKSRNYRRAS